MSKRSSTPTKKTTTKRKQPSDINLLAAQIVEAATGQAEQEPTTTTQQEKNPVAVVLGRLGGLKGGKARAAKLTPKNRSQIAKKAAKARWGKSENA